MPQDRSSTAHLIFDSITKSDDPIKEIRALISTTKPVHEDDFLECKGGQEQKFNRRQPLNEDDVKRIWSEALGGFANAGGGVLIWGLDGKEAITGENLVVAPHRFKGDLIRLSRGANVPPVSNVEVQAYAIDAEGQLGFVVCLIPATNLTHNCEYTKNKPYITRFGDSFQQIPPHDLRRRFYPHFAPQLTIDVRTSMRWNSHHFAAVVEAQVLAENSGTGTARDLLFVLRSPTLDTAITRTEGSPNLAEWRQTHNPNTSTISVYGKHYLHPRMQTYVHTYVWHVKPSDHTDFTCETATNKVLNAKFQPLTLEIEAYAENMPAMRSVTTITAEDAMKDGTVIPVLVQE